MALKYSAISIIYNPNSTGPSKRLASELRRQLRAATPQDKDRINIVPTAYVGHAEIMAYELSRASKQPLVIASGGDGSYHEVVNGIMRANLQGARAVAGLLPGGNANDHYYALHKQAVDAAILRGRPQTIDVLRVEMKHGTARRVRFAHSYCGFGLTAEAGRELNKNTLNRLKEGLLVIRTFRRLRPVKVLIRGQHRAYSSLVCSNIGRMSKILKLSSEAKPHDGNFELTVVRGPSKWRLLRALLLASTAGFPEVKHKQHFSFTTLKSIRLQLDGEIYNLKPETTVTITIDTLALRCYV